jgi:hypothetical protein
MPIQVVVFSPWVSIDRRSWSQRQYVDWTSADALAAAPGPTLYARVDACAVDGRLVLMELEVLEPSLFFAMRPAAAEVFATAVARVAAARAGSMGSDPIHVLAPPEQRNANGV